jgi:hypothetical protein
MQTFLSFGLNHFLQIELFRLLVPDFTTTFEFVVVCSSSPTKNVLILPNTPLVLFPDVVEKSRVSMFKKPGDGLNLLR